MENFILSVDNSPSILVAKDDSTGFNFITTATDGIRHYRITRENEVTEELSYYDFTLDLSDIEDGTPVVQEIPYISRKFISWTKTIVPEALDPTPSDPPEVFRGEVFKLLYITPQSQVPQSIKLDTTYTITGFERFIRFIYYRMITGVPQFIGKFGNIALDGQYSSVLTIDPKEQLQVLTIDDIDYYIIRISATPNIIFGNGLPVNNMITDRYSDKNGVNYVLKAPGHAQSGAGFSVILSMDNSEGQISDAGLDNLSVNIPGMDMEGLVFDEKRSAYIIAMKEARNVTDVDFRIFLDP
jgi:hypothetical protein